MYLGIDIGGTKTLIALFSRRGRILRKQKFKTPQGRESFVRELLDRLEAFATRPVKAVVIAVPGVVQKNCSVILGNREWGEFDIITPVKSLFNCDILLENDANLGALFEGHRLKGKTIFLTFSTGIGGGIVEDNRISPDSGGFEPGHWQYSYDGKTAEWEDIAAASALEKAYHVDKATSLRRKSEMKDVAQRMSLGLQDVIKRYSPDTVIIGGPMGKNFLLFSKYLPKIDGVRFKRPKRPTESVIYGCFILARQKENE